MIIDIKKRHQDNLKVEIYHQFRIRFIDVPFELLAEHKIGRCRFDLLLYEKGTNKLICLIEVRRIGARREVNGTSKKHIKYSAFGCPLFYISEFSKISFLLDAFERVYKENNF